MGRELTVGQGPAQAAAGIALYAEENMLFVLLHEKGGLWRSVLVEEWWLK